MYLSIKSKKKVQVKYPYVCTEYLNPCLFHTIADKIGFKNLNIHLMMCPDAAWNRKTKVTNKYGNTQVNTTRFSFCQYPEKLSLHRLLWNPPLQKNHIKLGFSWQNALRHVTLTVALTIQGRAKDRRSETGQIPPARRWSESYKV